MCRHHSSVDFTAFSTPKTHQLHLLIQKWYWYDIFVVRTFFPGKKIRETNTVSIFTMIARPLPEAPRWCFFYFFSSVVKTWRRYSMTWTEESQRHREKRAGRQPRTQGITVSRGAYRLRLYAQTKHNNMVGTEGKVEFSGRVSRFWVCLRRSK